LPTKDHFSSNCASRVGGGKSHEFVVEVVGVLASEDRQAYHGVLVDADQATGLTDAATLVQVLEHRERFHLRELGAVQRRTFAFGEALLAGPAGQDAAFLVGSIAEAHPQVVAAALTVVGAVGVLAAEGFQVIHNAFGRFQVRGKVDEQLELV
jgi:hypothetical protein